MPFRAARNALIAGGTSRAGRRLGLAALALLLGNTALQNAAAEGDTRTISLHHIHTGEDLTVTYKRNGRYDEEALKKLNHVLRDWRRDEEIRMDPRLLDVVWDVYRDVGAKEPIQIICGYRAPATNAMLRRRSRGVAQFSQHTLGRAMDFNIPGVSLETQREIGLRLQRGGVGYYPSSGFVHLDVGSVRHWPRMTHDQLARVFPDGRTVHVPSDGQPLRNYALALADLEKRGSTPSQTSIDTARNAGVNVAERPRKNLLASLFGAKDEDEDNETTSATKREPAPAPAASPKVEKTLKVAESRPIPMPIARPQIAAKVTSEPAPAAQPEPKPAPTFSVASAGTQTVLLSEPPRPPETIPGPSANDIVAARYWEELATPAAPPAPAEQKAQMQLASAASHQAQALRARAEARESTGAVTQTQWPLKSEPGADRVPQELALAYAALADVRPAQPVTRSLSMNPPIPRNAATIEQSGASTIARKVSPAAVTAAPAAPAATVAAARPAPATKKIGAPPFEDIWLRALALAPDLQNHMTTMVLGTPDPRELRPLMRKPDSAVMMTFSDNPNAAITTDRFTGSAVVFISTVTFNAPTARRDMASRSPSVFLTP